MKKFGAILFLAGAFVAGGTALAGPGDKCNVCHFPSHDMTQEGDVIVVGYSAWHSSHWPHGDCMIDKATENSEGDWVIGRMNDDGSCACEEWTPTETQ